MRKLKNQIFNVLKLLLIMHILISSGAALYGQISGSNFDPVKLADESVDFKSIATAALAAAGPKAAT